LLSGERRSQTFPPVFSGFSLLTIRWQPFSIDCSRPNGFGRAGRLALICYPPLEGIDDDPIAIG